MARIAGVDIPREKRLEISLTYIFGIGRTTAAEDLRPSSGSTPTPGSATSPTKRSTRSAPTSTRTSRSRATCAARSSRTSAQDGDRLLPGPPPPQGPPGPRPAHPDQRPHPQGPEEDRRRQEEGRASNGEAQARRPSAPQARAQERHLRRRAHQELVQQHDRHDHRPGGQRPLLGLGRQRRLQGLPQVARRSPPRWPPRRPPAAPWSTASARSTSW